MGFGVKQGAVFAAFRAMKIDFAPLAGQKHFFEVAAPNGEMNTEYIPPELGRREPQRLSEVYGVPLAWFYNTLMIPEDKKRKPN
jgi:hypothetical protein